MSHARTLLFASTIILFSSLYIVIDSFSVQNPQQISEVANSPTISIPSNTPTPTITLPPVPDRKLLQSDYHVFQTFNNCGPASFSMALSHYNISISQQELGQQLRPYQHPTGDNDDKSVTLAEIAEASKQYGFMPIHRPNGDMETIEKLITLDLPILVRTWLRPNEDIGHYRVLKGYDRTTREVFQDDSLQGKDLWYSYDEMNVMWEKFNYEYLVLVPPEKTVLVKVILGENIDEKVAWQKAVERARQEFAQNPEDVTAGFNLSVALYKVGEFEESVEVFEEVESRLPARTLWYQIEPILAYEQLGEYDKVFTITDQILQNGNRAFSELYLIRGRIYEVQGNPNLARTEYEKAVLYNKNMKEARRALDLL